MSLNPLRNIPSVNEVLENPAVKALVGRFSRHALVNTVKTVLDEVRGEVQTVAAERALPSVGELAERIARRVMEFEKLSLRPVINGTGILFDGGLGRAPLGAAAIEAMRAAAQDYASLDLDLASGDWSPRKAAIEGLLRELTGADAAMAVATGSGALMLAIGALAAGRQVIVARGDLGEQADGFRIAEAIAACGATLCEVGAVNRRRLDDYRHAITADTAFILRVLPLDYEIVASTANDTSLEDLAALGRDRQVPVVVAAFRSGMVDLRPAGLAGDVPLPACVRTGVDLVVAQGDALVGGPASGLVMGRRDLVGRLENHPLARAIGADKLTLAALAATLELYREPDKAWFEIPALSLLATSIDNLRNRAERLAPQLAATNAVAHAAPGEGFAYLTPGKIEALRMPSCRILVAPSGTSPERMAAALRTGSPGLVPGLAGGQLYVDLRTVLPRQDMDVVAAFAALKP